MESRIQKHDQQQFEIKLSYPLARDHRTDRYEVDVFLFLPYQLGVDESRYTTDQFYKDLNCYTRFKTPVFTLAQLHDATLSANPRARVEKKLAEAAAGGALDERGVLYELKVLGNIIRVQVRDRARVLGNAAREKRASVPETMAQLLRLAEESEQALDDLRGLVHVPRQELAGRHALALAEGALVDDAQLIVGHEERRGVQELVGLADLVAPVVEDPGFAQAAREAVFVDDDRVIVTDPQPFPILDARVRG